MTAPGRRAAGRPHRGLRGPVHVPHARQRPAAACGQLRRHRLAATQRPQPRATRPPESINMRHVVGVACIIVAPLACTNSASATPSTAVSPSAITTWAPHTNGKKMSSTTGRTTTWCRQDDGLLVDPGVEMPARRKLTRCGARPGPPWDDPSIPTYRSHRPDRPQSHQHPDHPPHNQRSPPDQRSTNPHRPHTRRLQLAPSDHHRAAESSSMNSRRAGGKPDPTAHTPRPTSTPPAPPPPCPPSDPTTPPPGHPDPPPPPPGDAPTGSPAHSAPQSSTPPPATTATRSGPTATCASTRPCTVET